MIPLFIDVTDPGLVASAVSMVEEAVGGGGIAALPTTPAWATPGRLSSCRSPVEVERELVEDLAGRVTGLEELPWRLAVTMFFHIHAVQELMEPRGIETVALSAGA